MYVQFIQGRGRARGNTFNRGVDCVSEMKPFHISGWLSLGEGVFFFFKSNVFRALKYVQVHTSIVCMEREILIKTHTHNHLLFCPLCLSRTRKRSQRFFQALSASF